MNLKFLKSSDKKKLLMELNERFGIANLPLSILIETGKGKIRGFSGHMTRDEIKELSEIANVEIIGLYLIKKDEMFGLRLSLDGTIALNQEIRNNVLEIDDDQLNCWMRGNNLDLVKEKGVCVIKHRKSGDFVGCCVSDGKKLINYLPKERRIRRS